MTFSITTLSIMSLIATLSITTLGTECCYGTTKLSIMCLNATLSITILNIELCYVECRFYTNAVSLRPINHRRL